jgi:hypothetical protein
LSTAGTDQVFTSTNVSNVVGCQNSACPCDLGR